MEDMEDGLEVYVHSIKGQVETQRRNMHAPNLIKIDDAWLLYFHCQPKNYHMPSDLKQHKFVFLFSESYFTL